MRKSLSIGAKGVNVGNVDTLAEFIVMRRESLGLSQTELATRSGIAATTLNKIEKGTTNWPSADVRRRLAKALCVRHVDVIVATGELAPEEISSVAARWPTDDPALIKLLEYVELLPPGSFDHTLKVLGMIRDADWPPTL